MKPLKNYEFSMKTHEYANMKVIEKNIMQQIRYALEAHKWFVFRVPQSVYGHKGLCGLIYGNARRTYAGAGC